MTPRCPEPDDLAMWLDRELSERRADEVRAHVATCSVCTERIRELERVIGDLRVPAATRPVPIARVMANLDALPARRGWGGLGFAVAAAAAVVVLAVWRPQPEDRGTFEARGGGSSSLERQVGTTLYALAPRATRLLAGTRVRADAAFVIGYRNLARDRAVWALVFAVDAAGETHWLYPGYTAAAGDPQSIRFAPSDTETLLADSVVLDRVSAGALRVVVVISQAPLHVSAIEALHGAELAIPALQRRFADAAISEIPLEVSR